MRLLQSVYAASVTVWGVKPRRCVIPVLLLIAAVLKIAYHIKTYIMAHI